MSAELPDSYQAIYQRAIQQMGVGESHVFTIALKNFLLKH